MAKTKIMLLATLLATASASFAAPTVVTPPTENKSYEISEFTADFTRFTLGDTAPALYRSDKYSIKKWQVRNLPAPEAGSHWTYMGTNYVLISDSDGKILKAFDGNIFYQR
ncbi:RcnB family protein [Winslowiella iniecta]|uniref:Nickel/cobalt homeostasis protein RcnB n=1 Tax=Winslowiella iniecta TaxID=1560201 RepID=A0A0L7T0N1_9GAMM|nr:RcnB family protein [Winslowiella iniecta]KOC88845.1 nickel/cobalt homeostasis protein RcnB [Winslowiella iniecta]KOC92184.1 nickel/cobalt homeostasis protein RcnB [Winslowiella iniecta]